MVADVFISYADQDKRTADTLLAGLESRGIGCWIAPRDIPPGHEWAKSIIDAIAQTRLMVLVYSEHTNESEHVKSEVRCAFDRRHTIIAFRIEDVPFSDSFELFVCTRQHLDAYGSPLEEHIGALADAIMSDLSDMTAVSSKE